jgi:hypothetical protein
VPLLPPRIGVARADPAVVRRVRAEEEAAEREGKEKEMRELNSGGRDRQEVANPQVLANRVDACCPTPAHFPPLPRPQNMNRGALKWNYQ